MPKFIASSAALLKVLQPLASLIPSNPVMPVLAGFLFQVTGNTLAITASDLGVSLVTQLPVESGAGALDACVPARLLLDLLKQLPDQPLTFDVDEDSHLVVVHAANGRYQLAGDQASDFPRVPVIGLGGGLEIPSTSLARAIGKTLFAISTDELRPAMTGVLLQLEADRITCVATDGHRLLRYRRLDVGGGAGPKNVIVPKKAWALLKSTLPSEAVPVQVQFSASNAFFSWHGLRLVCRLIDERYPDYENVIPVENPNRLLINRLELLNAARRCALLANKTTHQVRLDLAGAALTLSAEDADFSHAASERLVCQYDGQDMAIGFNSRFLIEMLSHLNDEEVSLALSTPNRAGLLEPAQQQAGVEDVLMLVMPTMLSNYV